MKNKNTITTSRKVKHKQLYNKIWEKIESLMSIDFENKPIYGDDDKYIKTKIKTHAYSIFTNFHNRKCLKKKYDVSAYQ